MASCHSELCDCEALPEFLCVEMQPAKSISFPVQHYGTHDAKRTAFARDQKHFLAAGNKITFVKQPVELLGVQLLTHWPEYSEHGLGSYDQMRI